MKLIEVLEAQENSDTGFGWVGVKSAPSNSLGKGMGKPDAGTPADDEMQSKLGTFVGLIPSLKAKQKLVFFCEDNNIPNPVTADDMHCTLIKSARFLDGFDAEGNLPIPITAYNLQCAIFEKKEKGQPKRRILVVKMESPMMEARRQKILDAFEDSYLEEKKGEEFVPHITLSYDMDNDELDIHLLSYNIAKYLETIEFDTEYEEPLEVDGAGDDAPKNKPKK